MDLFNFDYLLIGLATYIIAGFIISLSFFIYDKRTIKNYKSKNIELFKEIKNDFDRIDKILYTDVNEFKPKDNYITYTTLFSLFTNYNLNFDYDHIIMAIDNEDLKIAEILMNEILNIEIKNLNCQSPVEKAINNNSVDFLRILIPENTIMENDYEYLSLCEQDKNNTLLEYAIRKNKLDVVKFLVDERGCRLYYNVLNIFGMCEKYVEDVDDNLINDNLINSVIYDEVLFNKLNNYTSEIKNIVEYMINNKMNDIISFLKEKHVCFKYTFNSDVNVENLKILLGNDKNHNYNKLTNDFTNPNEYTKPNNPKVYWKLKNCDYNTYTDSYIKFYIE